MQLYLSNFLKFWLCALIYILLMMFLMSGNFCRVVLKGLMIVYRYSNCCAWTVSVSKNMILGAVLHPSTSKAHPKYFQMSRLHLSMYCKRLYYSTKKIMQKTNYAYNQWKIFIIEYYLRIPNQLPEIATKTFGTGILIKIKSQTRNFDKRNHFKTILEV